MNTSLAEELGMPLATQLVATRRDLHRNAEPGWCEFRTTAKIIETLRALDWEIKFGRDVISNAARMGVPSAEELDKYYQRALALGADAELLSAMKGGFTGVVASIRGSLPGPSIALRFDIDANLGPEARTEDHLPSREGFSSINFGIHHNCGHDGHTAIGLAVARVLSESKASLFGEVRMIFQPAEEGLRGANAMVAAGVLDGVDFFLGCHVGVQSLKLGEIITGYHNLLASVKIDATFVGKNAHAAISPHVGRNALLAACVATQNLLAIPRHGDGETRVNVGLLSGGESRNAIPATARLSAELRADSTAILDHLAKRADWIFEGAAQMQGVEFSTSKVGGSCAASSDPEMMAIVARAASALPAITGIKEAADFKGSDDAAAMMAAVQQQGGKAAYFGLGTELKDVHHNPRFDFDERVLPIGVDLFVEAIKCCADTRSRTESSNIRD